jgi:hypothetical protein
VRRPAECQPLVVGQVELGPHLDVELVDERPFLRNADRVRVEFRRAERRNGLLVGQLLQARHQHLRLDLLGDRLVVLPLDQLARGLAGAEAADLRLVALDQFRVLLVEPLVDLLALDGDLDVLLARADVLDLDRLLQFDRPFGGRGRGGVCWRFRCFRCGVVGHRCCSLGMAGREWGSEK